MLGMSTHDEQEQMLISLECGLKVSCKNEEAKCGGMT